jgi:hypothetical protein
MKKGADTVVKKDAALRRGLVVRAFQWKKSVSKPTRQ